jgi:hypothetical protein
MKITVEYESKDEFNSTQLSDIAWQSLNLIEMQVRSQLKHGEDNTMRETLEHIKQICSEASYVKESIQ